ncbi:MAG: ADP-ribosylglycohydrolase family protein [Candidatus Obscuribacter sp.]|nr:ADP-ribosylglycohydrolase family protein [Candidatus Obscuribacter sp.]MBK9277335.1 ADP-ribosylglycohydrolase family protein [Candidatus Obscuribacter sp.]
MALEERFSGSLLGLACGDAVGASVEFCRPGSFEPVTDMLGGGFAKLQPGQWTDDTSMALCLAKSLIECKGFDPTDQMQRYVRWFKDGYLSSTGQCFDIGRTTRTALDKFVATGNAYAGDWSEKSAGNGSIMRLAPVPLFFFGDPAEALDKCADSSRTTHWASTCLDACRYFGGLIIGALQGASKEELLSERYCPVAKYWTQNEMCEEIAMIALGSFKVKQPPEIRGTGYVVQSLEAALWAFYNSDSFKDGCLMAVNLGEDADTTAAVYGQLAGAYYGLGGIPADWLAKLAMRELIEATALDLCRCSAAEEQTRDA